MFFNVLEYPFFPTSTPPFHLSSHVLLTINCLHHELCNYAIINKQLIIIQYILHISMQFQGCFGHFTLY